jgi:hypothetical protein
LKRSNDWRGLGRCLQIGPDQDAFVAPEPAAAWMIVVTARMDLLGR